jgi:hypothetical protein
MALVHCLMPAGTSTSSESELWNYEWLQAPSAMQTRDITQLIEVNPCRRFGATYRSRLQGPMGCPETPVRNYHYTLHNIPAERITHLAVMFLPEGNPVRSTGWSKSLCAPDDYSTHNWWFEDGHHRIHSECGPCYTEHGLREHSSACQ